MNDLEQQLRRAWSEASPDPASVAAIRRRLEREAERSAGRRRGWTTTLLAAAGIAGWCVALLLARRPASTDALRLRVTEARGGAIAGMPGTFLSLEDAEGRLYHLVQASLPEGASVEPAVVALDSSILRVSGGNGVLVGLSVPKDAAPDTRVRRARSMVISGGDSPTSLAEDSTMELSITREAAARLTRAVLLALATQALPAVTVAAEPGAQATAPKSQAIAPAIYAVKAHADWCPSCRKVGRVFDDLAARLEESPVLFVEMDITNPATIRQSEYLAASLGIQDAWRASEGAGYILLIDARSREVIGRMNLDLSLDELERRTRDAL